MKYPKIPKDLKDGLHKKSNLEKYEDQFKSFKKILKPRDNTKVLEIGGGEGITVSILNLNSYNAYGLEPQEKYIVNAHKILKENNIDLGKMKKGFSEAIPFPDSFFDYVISYQVIEHVSDVAKTFQEIERVLKPGGETLHICPNYRSFYEGHYKVPMLPFMNKKFFKIYVSCLKKLFFWKRLGPDISYIDGLNFVTPRMVKEISEKNLKSLFVLDNASEILSGQGLKNYKQNFLCRRGDLIFLRTLKTFFVGLDKLNLMDPFIKFVTKKGMFLHVFIVGEKVRK